MARFVTVQTNFTTGELDPLLRARLDLDKTYQNALEKATNVLCQPQGGVTRRGGLRYKFALPNTGAESAANGVRLVPFEFSVTDSYMLCFTHNRMHVFKQGVLITNINGSGNPYLDTTALALTASVLGELVWTQSADTLIAVNENLPPVKIVRGGTDALWTASVLAFDSVPRYAFTPVFTLPAGTLTPSSVSGKCVLTASAAATFTGASVGQYINMTPQGRAKIIEFVSGTVVNAVLEFPVFSTSAIASGNWELESGYEPVWSASRGYPRAVTFHQGRLYFGGSKTRPSTLWGSKVGLFFDFDPTEGFADDAVEATLDTNTYNAIVDIISARDLLVLTTGGEFYVPQQGLEPITPSSFFVTATSRNGAKPGVRVQQLESGVMFIQRQGKSLSEIAFSDTQLTYMTNKISLLSGHLIKGPTRMALRRAVDTDENDLLLITNGDDGSMAVYSLLSAQSVIAPSEFKTINGSFVDVGVDITYIYVVVKRLINAVYQYYVELFEHNLHVDSAITGGAAATASATHLVGATVNVVLDGLVQANQVVPGGGTVTFPRSSTASYVVGVPIATEIRTMPVELRLATGVRIGFKKRIVEVNAMLLDSQNMVVNNIEVPFRSFDTADMLDNPVPDFTGTKTLNGILGYSQDARIVITQSAPLKLTVLGMEYKVAVYQGS